MVKMAASLASKFTAWKMSPFSKFIKAGIASCIVFGAGYSLFVLNKRRKIRGKILKKRSQEQKIINDLRDDLKLKYERNKEHFDFILTLTPPNLISAMQNGKLNPDDVLVAYVYKALNITKDFNCVSNAILEAFDFVKDVQVRSTGNSLPLYGLPVSLKECISLKGHATTFGVAKLINVIQTNDSVIAETLKHCGAIPFVRTNLPQTMISFESSNPIYGETGNPHNNNFCPGGSSSGEGCLIGAGGSPLGFGTDMGGSIRCPSHMCGVCGFKPTQNRISCKGILGPMPGHTDICSTVGPIAKDVDTLVLAMKSLLCDFMFKKDSSIPPLHFNDDVYQSKQSLRIGFYVDNGYTKAAPACERTVMMAKQHLEAAGHTLVPFQFPDIDELMKLTTEALFADNGKMTSSFLEDDVVDKRIKYLWRNWHMNPFIRWVMSKVTSLKHPRLGHLLMAFGGLGSVYESWQLTASIWQFQETFSQYWESLNIDAIISPSYPIAACPKGSLEYIFGLMSYTIPYNVLNYPAGVVTVSAVNEQDIKDLENYKGHYNDPWDWDILKAAKCNLGMPVSVQCIARPWNEELCLRLMKEVEGLVKSN